MPYGPGVSYTFQYTRLSSRRKNLSHPYDFGVDNDMLQIIHFYVLVTLKHNFIFLLVCLPSIANPKTCCCYIPRNTHELLAGQSFYERWVGHQTSGTFKVMTKIVHTLSTALLHGTNRKTPRPSRTGSS